MLVRLFVAAALFANAASANVVDHFYTTNAVERSQALGNGYVDEGTTGFVFPSPAPGTTPLFRLFHPSVGDHFYTISAQERDGAIATYGYRDEGIAAYVHTSQKPGTTALLRLSHATVKDHFYTTTPAERDIAIAAYGYTAEGQVGYIFLAQSPGTVPLFRLLRNDAAVASSSECAPGWEQNGELCYLPCPAAYVGAGPFCWQSCPDGYTNDGATCRRDAHIINADNSQCPAYDKCGLTLSRGCSTCPDGYSNDGCTCRRDVHIFGRSTTDRGAGQPLRWAFRDAFAKFVQLHRPGVAVPAEPLTAAEKVYLKQFFPARLVDSMKVTVVPGMTLPFFTGAGATTVGSDLIVIKDGSRSKEILKHEFVHVCQYEQLGVEAFMRAYADGYVDAGYDYDKNRFELEAKYFETLSGPIANYLHYCD